MSRITFLGLGAMGARMAARLVGAGHDLRVWNRTAEHARTLGELGATIGASPRAAARDAEIIIAMLRDDAASRAVWLDPEDGALEGAEPGALAIESSTLSLGWVEHLGYLVRARGLGFIDAPVLGSRPQAEAGQLVYLVGGDTADLAHARPVLDTMGGAVHHVGPLGAGAAMKLAANTLFATQVAVLGEILGALERQGIAVDQAAPLLAQLPVASPVAKVALDSIAARRFDPLFPIELVAKDLAYFTRSAAEDGAAAPVAQAVATAFAEADAAGLGDRHLTAIAERYRAGGVPAIDTVPVRSSLPQPTHRPPTAAPMAFSTTQYIS